MAIGPLGGERSTKQEVNKPPPSGVTLSAKNSTLAPRYLIRRRRDLNRQFHFLELGRALGIEPAMVGAKDLVVRFDPDGDDQSPDGDHAGEGSDDSRAA